MAKIGSLPTGPSDYKSRANFDLNVSNEDEKLARSPLRPLSPKVNESGCNFGRTSK
jgi:hypothetical protein